MRASPKSTEAGRPPLTCPLIEHGIGLYRVQLCPATRVTDEKRGGNHVNVSPERDALPAGTASGPWVGSESSWRNQPQSTVTIEVLGAVLLVCLGLLLGSSWTIQALQSNLRQQAAERRRLNAEWAAVSTVRKRRGRCPRCGIPLSEQDLE